MTYPEFWDNLFEKTFTVDWKVFRTGIKKVIFNNPATIILWEDGTKTIAKCCPGDKYDREKGFMVAYLKKVLGKDFKEVIDKWVTEDSEDDPTKPLTTEQLRKMNGEMVWVSSINYYGIEVFNDKYCGWRRVRGEKLVSRSGNYYEIWTNGIDCGFRAYRVDMSKVKKRK